MSKKMLAIATLALLLSGCTSVEGDFPSLSKRLYETDDPLAETPAPSPLPVTSALPGDLQSETDALVARAQKAHDVYAAALPAARDAAQAASGAPPGSESWVNAHVVLSKADGARADAVAALGAIDQLIAKQRDQGADAGLIALLSAPQGNIAALVNEENTEIERLAKLIGL